MWQTFGHQNQKLFLDNLIASGKLSHAYLFYGPKAIGKKTLAIEFANKILACGSEMKINPDLIRCDGENMSVAAARELIYELSLRPYQHKYKIAIIDNFDLAAPETASSVLKTLEEPNASSIIILIAAGKKNLLATIVSRCQSLYFNPHSRTDLAEFSAENKLDFQEGVLKLGRLIDFKSNSAAAADFKGAVDFYKKIMSLGKIERLAEVKRGAESETADLARMLEHWLDFEHAEFCRRRPDKYFNLQALIEALHGCRQNLNKKLLLEKLFLNLI